MARKAIGYRQEEGVAPDSATETFVAIRTSVESWRWSGVPFLLRAGKRLAKRVTEVAIHFRQPPLSLFRTVECEGDVCDLAAARPNVLCFRIQPDEGIHLSFSTKRPGMNLDLQAMQMDFFYGHSFSKSLPEAYERLLLDALRGDRTLFMNADEVEAAWEFATPILDYWKEAGRDGVATYAARQLGTQRGRRPDRRLQLALANAVRQLEPPIHRTAGNELADGARFQVRTHRADKIVWDNDRECGQNVDHECLLDRVAELVLRQHRHGGRSLFRGSRRPLMCLFLGGVDAHAARRVFEREGDRLAAPWPRP